MNAEFKVFLEPNARMPKRAHENDAGFDLFSNEGGIIQPLDRRSVHTGVHIELHPGWEAQVRSRSGLSAKAGVIVLNSPGTVDADYRGEVMITLLNTGDDEYVFHSGDRLAQLVIKEVPAVDLVQTHEPLGETVRGSNGHGSSGR